METMCKGCPGTWEALEGICGGPKVIFPSSMPISEWEELVKIAFSTFKYACLIDFFQSLETTAKRLWSKLEKTYY